MWFGLAACAVNLDFIEIGTSNFDTLLQRHAGLGLSVEALSLYLDDLPNNPNVTKVNVAIIDDALVDAQPAVPFFYVHPKNITKYRLPWWLKGCNTAFSPHNEAIHYLRKRQLPELMEEVMTPTSSYRRLVERYSVESVELLKLDMEGFEVPVLYEVLSICQTTQNCPSTIIYESKHMMRRNMSQYTHMLVLLDKVYACKGRRSSQTNDASDKVCLLRMQRLVRSPLTTTPSASLWRKS